MILPRLYSSHVYGEDGKRYEVTNMNSQTVEQIIKLKREIRVKANKGVELSRQIQQANSAREAYELSQELAQITGEMKNLKARLAATTSTEQMVR